MSTFGRKELIKRFVEQEKDRFFSYQEENWFLAKFDEIISQKNSQKIQELKDVFQICMAFGLRSGEAVSLISSPQLIDLNGRILHLRNITIGNTDFKIIEKDKNGKTFDYPIPDHVLEIFRRRIDPKNPTKKLFHYSANELGKAFKEIRDAGGYDPLLTLHCCRHTFAMRLLPRIKNNVKQLQEAMRHKSLKSTMHYVHLGERNDLMNTILDMNSAGKITPISTFYEKVIPITPHKFKLVNGKPLTIIRRKVA